MVEPRCARRRHLSGQVKVRAVDRDERWPPIVGAAKAANLDDAAGRRGMGEGFDAAEPNMVGAAIRAVDHGIGLTGQFVMQALVHEPADDRRLRRARVDDTVGDPAL